MPVLRTPVVCLLNANFTFLGDTPGEPDVSECQGESSRVEIPSILVTASLCLLSDAGLIGIVNEVAR